MAGVWWLWVLVAYLSGSAPFGVLLGRARGVDIRARGSRNVGATNVGRVLGRRWGMLCFALDVLKGLLPVLGAGWDMGVLGKPELTGTEGWRWLAVAAAAVLGHVFCPWLKFRGGKGVATGLGALLGFWPVLTVPAVAALATWALMAVAFRYVSLASITAAASLPAYLLLWSVHQGRSLRALAPLVVVTALLALLVVVRHRANLGRLLAGTESKIGRGRPAEAEREPPRRQDTKQEKA